MLKVFTTCVFLILNISSTIAQNHFEITVLDHDSKEPLIGVTVIFPNLNIGNTTDANGQVVVSNIPNGNHLINIRHIGYETISFSRFFPLQDSEQNQTFEMHHDHEEMSEIVVSSTRSSRTIEDIPTRVEFIAGEELAEKGNMTSECYSMKAPEFKPNKRPLQVIIPASEFRVWMENIPNC